MTPDKVDVLVIGGGPAGSMAALEAARAGASVLLVEAKRKFGERPHCAEYVPRALALEIDFPDRAVVQSVEAMETVVDGETTVTEAPGYILDRAVFDHGLAEAAASAGAIPLVATRLAAVDGDGWMLMGPGRIQTVHPKVVVAADGATGTVRRLLGKPGARRLTGVQAEVQLTDPMNRTRVYFGREWRFGYAWLFPKGRSANLGLGMAEFRPAEARDALSRLKNRLLSEGTIRPGITGRSVGAIVVSGPFDEFQIGRVLFAGDAAGLTHPITGAGIPQAAISGREAGKAAAQIALGRDPDAARVYEKEIRSRYGRTLEHAAAKRADLERRWDEEDFGRLVRRTWPAFREYRR
jgi:geranylgeranyl reductase family protein